MEHTILQYYDYYKIPTHASGTHPTDLQASVIQLMDLAPGTHPMDLQASVIQLMDLASGTHPMDQNLVTNPMDLA